VRTLGPEIHKFRGEVGVFGGSAGEKIEGNRSGDFDVLGEGGSGVHQNVIAFFNGTLVARSTTTESDCARSLVGETEIKNSATANANGKEDGYRSFLGIMAPCARRKLRNSRRQLARIAIGMRSRIQCLTPAPDQTFGFEEEN
jgi:hypothetical protein